MKGYPWGPRICCIMIMTRPWHFSQLHKEVCQLPNIEFLLFFFFLQTQCLFNNFKRNSCKFNEYNLIIILYFKLKSLVLKSFICLDISPGLLCRSLIFTSGWGEFHQFQHQVSCLQWSLRAAQSAAVFPHLLSTLSWALSGEHTEQQLARKYNDNNTNPTLNNPTLI